MTNVISTFQLLSLSFVLITSCLQQDETNSSDTHTFESISISNESTTKENKEIDSNFYSSEDGLSAAPKFEVNRVYPPISISKEKLKEAYSLIDLNTYFKSSWIREYISVEISTIHKGKLNKTLSTSDILSQEQKENLNKADANMDILVKVLYIPENSLTDNDPKEMNFTIVIDPENNAEYAGGQETLRQYLIQHAIDKISEGTFVNYDLAAIKFTINEKGQVMDIHLFNSSNHDKIDELLLETIKNMPNWIPAEHSNGLRVKQEFVLTVGNMENCMINLLNIRRC